MAGLNRQEAASAARLFSRRRWLATSVGIAGGFLSPADFLLRKSLAATTGAGGGSRAKSCIFVYLWGGISHLESWDLKPDAPAEVRGEFKPIPSIVPGIDVSEHLPLLARQTDKLAIIRSIYHDD